MANSKLNTVYAGQKSLLGNFPMAQIQKLMTAEIFLGLLRVHKISMGSILGTSNEL
jgi:hypothetical protein